MQNSCINCSRDYPIDERDLLFYSQISVPSPKMCPECRMRRRTSFRNERTLYKRKCDFSGKDILAVYPPTSEFKVYDQKIWWSDDFNPMQYGREYDFNRPFFEQFAELMKAVPRTSLQNRNNENSDYGNDTADLKDSYLCYNAEQARNFYYCTTAGYGSDCMDIFWGMQIELCYESAKVIGAYHCFWCFNCSNVSDCYFCEDLIGCKNCFGCVGLRHKEYFIRNRQVTKEEFRKFMDDFSFTKEKIDEEKNMLKELRLKIPRKALEMTRSEDCVGDYVSNSKNCTDCFDVMDSENCRYVWDGIVKNAYDCFNVGLESSFLYESIAVYRGNNLKFCVKCSASNDLEYSDFCYSCSDCFGCVGLRHKKYCILNRQYTKEEFTELRKKIIDHMGRTGEYGEFFPAGFSPFGYNDSVASWYFPLTREDALKKGFKWNDYVSPKPEQKAVTADNLPERIEDVTDDILDKAIECEKDGKLFRLIPQELEFYRKHRLPIPHDCPDCRQNERMSFRNPRKLYNRACAKCNAPIRTTYAPDRPETVYCEKCYLEAVY